MAHAEEGLHAAILLARRRLGFTQAQVAERLGISVPYFSDIERGHRQPTVEKTRQLAEILDVDPNQWEWLALRQRIEKLDGGPEFLERVDRWSAAVALARQHRQAHPVRLYHMGAGQWHDALCECHICTDLDAALASS